MITYQIFILGDSLQLTVKSKGLTTNCTKGANGREFFKDSAPACEDGRGALVGAKHPEAYSELADWSNLRMLRPYGWL
jgi:hypothetical protein